MGWRADDGGGQCPERREGVSFGWGILGKKLRLPKPSSSFNP